MPYIFLKVHLALNLMNNGQIMREEVGLDYRDGVIKVEAAAIDGKTPVTMMYHTTKVNINVLSI